MLTVLRQPYCANRVAIIVLRWTINHRRSPTAHALSINSSKDRANHESARK
jgi:hypothetical protein